VADKIFVIVSVSMIRTKFEKSVGVYRKEKILLEYRKIFWIKLWRFIKHV
jgi:hypothetical protein